MCALDAEPRAARPGSLTDVRFVLYGEDALSAFQKEAETRLVKKTGQEEGQQEGDGHRR